MPKGKHVEVPEGRELKELLDRLDKIASGLGEGANYFWPLAIRQVYINLGVSCIWLGISGGFLFFVRQLHSTATGPDTILTGTGTIAGLVLVAGTFLNLVNRVSQALNPAYTALVELIKYQEVQ